MWIYVKLAWRNLLRNKRRSLIAGTAIGIGLASLIFVDALVIGMERNMVETATATFLGEGEIQRAGFRSTQQADLTINQPDWMTDQLKQEKIIQSFSRRVLTYAVISSPADMCSIELAGIEPEKERAISEIDEAVFEGSYFAGNGVRDIVIGSKLAEALEAGLGDRLVVTVSQAGTGMLAQDLFRVSGIFRFGISEMDRGMAFIRLQKAQELLNIGKNVHSIVLKFRDPANGSDPSLPFWEKYSRFGNKASGWPVIMPKLSAVFQLSRFSIYLVGLILFAVVALGIINTLFMSIHERMFEFGVLRAVGTRPFGIAKLIICEAGSLAVLSNALGCSLAFLITAAVAGTGIDYTGIEYVGVTFRKLIYPVLNVRQFIEYPLWVFIFTLFAGIYPAIHAARMSPSEAMRRSF